MIRMQQAAACVAFLGLSVSSLQAADLLGSYKDDGAGYWVVTLGGYIAAQPDYPGSKEAALSFRPIIDIHRPGATEWITLPNDAASVTVLDGANYRIGVALDYITDRPENSHIRGLSNINYTGEIGGFAEYYPAPFLRTRVELLQGVTGADGLAANFAADLVYKPQAQWLFTAGPRLKLVNEQYQSTFFSVESGQAAVANLPAYHASGGINSAGIDATARYNINQRFSIRAFAEWDRLEGDAADSPIVKLRGSEDQWQAGIGASYRFNYSAR